MSPNHRKDHSLAQPHSSALITTSSVYTIFSSLLFSGKKVQRSVMEIKSKKSFVCYSDKPDDKNYEKGMMKLTSELLARTEKQSLALSARNINVKF